MLVRLYAGEIIMGRITEDDVPREAEGPRAQVSRRHGLLRRRRGVSPNNKEGRVLRPSGFYEVTQ